MRIAFYLDKPDSPTSAVMLNIAFRGYRLRFGTGVSTTKKHWNNEKQQPRFTDPNLNANSRRLNVIEQFVRQAYNDLQFDNKRTLVGADEIAVFKKSIAEFLSPSKSNVAATAGFESDFQQFIDTYTLTSASGLVTTKRPAENTLQIYRRTLGALQEFSKARHYPLEYESINQEFYQTFFAWASNDCGLVDASISNFIKVLKTFLKWSRKRGHHSTTEYESFYGDKRTVERIALSVDDLRIIRDLDLSDSKRLSRVRDHFLLQSYTGLRYGDLVKLEPHHFDDKAGVIRLTTTKTDTPCIIPITKPLSLLLERYPSRLFEFPSQVKQNLYIKELGVRAGFTQQTTVSHYRSGKRVEEVKTKSELITTHVARRTFVSTSIRFGVPESVISVVTGHSAKGTLQQHYIRLDEGAIKELVCNAWEKL